MLDLPERPGGADAHLRRLVAQRARERLQGPGRLELSERPRGHLPHPLIGIAEGSGELTSGGPVFALAECVRRFAPHLPGGVLQRGHDRGGHGRALEIGEGGHRARAHRGCLVFQCARQGRHRLFVLQRAQRAGNDPSHLGVRVGEHPDERARGAGGRRGIVGPCHGAGGVRANGGPRILQRGEQRLQRRAAEPAEGACRFEGGRRAASQPVHDTENPMLPPLAVAVNRVHAGLVSEQADERGDGGDGGRRAGEPGFAGGARTRVGVGRGQAGGERL